MLTQHFFSALAQEEAMAILRASTLPPTNDSWRDGFTVSPTQPFQGVIDADSFRLTRLQTNKSERRISPLPVIGCISAAAPNQAGSQLVLKLRPASIATLANGVVWGLAIFSFAAILVREWPNFRLVSLLYFLLPACFTAASYIQLRSEATAYEKLLGPLLKLTKQP